MTRGTCMLVALVLATACDAQRAEPGVAAKSTSEPSREGAPPAPARAPTPTPAPKAERAKPSLTRAELKALLDAWLAAQNDGDFAAYQRLYAADMQGVKRVGARESRFDRTRWMADRARMFRKPMEVGVRDVSFSGHGSTARIDFVQVFRQGTFMDTGPKRLAVTERDGAARIVHEEMLASEVLAQASVLDDRAFVVFESGETAYVVVEESAQPSWGAGPFTIDPQSHGSIYVQPVNLDATPRGREWIGRSLRVVDAMGRTCLATVRELQLVVITEERYVDEDDPDVKKLLETHDLDTARALYLMREQPPTLVGRLDGCKQGVATPASQPEPVVYVSDEVDPAFEARARTAARALPAYRALQARWETMWREATEGAELEPGEQPGEWSGGIVSLFGAEGGPRFASVLFSSGGCGLELAADLFVLYRLGPKGELSLLTTSSSAVLAELLLDVDHDGALEIYSAGSDDWLGTLYGVGSSGVRRLEWVPYLYGGCGC